MNKTERIEKVNELLSNRHAMDAFIHKLSYLDLDNYSGGAYRAVRLCRYDKGMLLTSEHSTFDYCSIKIATVPTTNIFRGCQDSCANGNPNPRVEEGELVTVWSDGKWIKEGPWMPKIREWLVELLEKAETTHEKRGQEEQEKREAALQAKQAKDEAVIAAWS